MPLDWLAVAGLAPEVHARLVELEAAVWTGSIEPAVVQLVRTRTAQLLGAVPELEDEALAEITARGPAAPELDDEARAVLRWVDQFVTDPNGLTRQDVDALGDFFDPRQCGELTTAVAVFEGLARTRLALLP